MKYIYKIKPLVEVYHKTHKSRSALVEASLGDSGDETLPSFYPKDSLRVFLQNPKVLGVQF